MTEDRHILLRVFDSAEPLGRESIEPELTTEGLEAERLVGGCLLSSVYS